MKTIIFVCGKNPLTASGGYARYAANMGKLVKGLGIEVEIYCVGRKKMVKKTPFGKVIACGTPLFSFPIIQHLTMLAFPIFSIQMASSIQKSHKNEQLIIWGIGPWSLTGVILKYLFRQKSLIFADYFTSISHEFMGKVIGMPISDYGILRWIGNKVIQHTLIPFYSFLESILIKKVDQVITHYKSTEQILRNEFKLSHKQFVHLPYAIDLPPVKVSKNLSPIPRIVLIGRQDGRKGINYFLHGCKILEDKNIIFEAYIIGSGELMEANKNLAKKLGLKSVHFAGYVKSPITYFTKQSIFVLPSLEEGSSSLSLLEAMANRMPIIATRIDGIPEDVENYTSGVLIPPNKPDKLADALQKLISQPTNAYRIGQEARRSYEAKHNPRTTQQKIRQFLRSFDTFQSH